MSDHLHESISVDVRAANGVRHEREHMLSLARSVARNVAIDGIHVVPVTSLGP